MQRRAFGFRIAATIASSNPLPFVLTAPFRLAGQYLGLWGLYGGTNSNVTCEQNDSEYNLFDGMW